jgi:hypothetical protein
MKANVSAPKAVFPQLFFYGGAPKIILYPNEPLPKKTFTGQKTKRHLIMHGDYSGITNFRPNNPAIFRGIFGISRCI